MPISIMITRRMRHEMPCNFWSSAVIKAKRVYDPPKRSDGYRILVDRIWPRGISKENAHISLWLKEIAPSPEIRKWFSHNPEKWSTFLKRYHEEIRKSSRLLVLKNILRKHKSVTFVYSAKDPLYNN